MSIASKLLQATGRVVAEELKASKSEVHQMVGKHLAACGVSGCTRFTVGGVCRNCSRHACIGHVYLTAAVPPVLMCAECIALEFEVDRSRTLEKP